MKCPFCGHSNIPGEDECEKCGEDLTAFDGVHPKDRLERSLVKNTIEVLETSEPVLVSPTTSVQEVAQHLADENRSVLVMEGEKIVGIVTERDILFKVIDKKKDLEKIPVSEIMTPNPETLKKSDKIVYALNKMAIGGFRRLPVLEGGQKIRVLSVRNILAYLAEMFPGVVGIHS